ncbi:MAG: polysaccharide biosynthesis C-terminal domain-containing protein [Candidatus Kapaibacteriota bacterium]
MNIKTLLPLDTSNLKYLLGKGGISFLFRMLGMGLSFYIIDLVSNAYNVDTYGNFSLVQSTILVLTMIFTLGIQNVLIINVATTNPDDYSAQLNILFKAIKLILFTSIIPIIVIYLFSKFIAINIFSKEILQHDFKNIALFLLPFLLHEIILYFFVARKKFISFGLFMFVLPNTFFILLVLICKKILIQNINVTLLYGLSFLITFLIEIIYIYKPFKIISNVISYKEIIKNALPMMTSGLLLLLLNTTNVFMLGIMSTSKSVGIYNASYKIGLLVLLVLASVNVIIGPKIAELFHKNKIAELKKIIHQSTYFTAIMTLPIVLFLLVFNKDLLAYLGSNFQEGSTVLTITIFASFFSAISGNVDQILNMSNNQNTLLRINLICLVINILLCYILIPKYDIVGAAIASMFSTVLMNLICNIYIKKKLGFFTFF